MKIAVVGLGEAGFTIHLPALAGLAGVSVVGAADDDAGRRDRAAAAFGVPIFATLEEMLARNAPDVVVVATPPDFHVDQCLRALAAGAHVICEKPFTPRWDDADALLAAAAAAGRQIAVNHQFRHMPIFDAVIAEARRAGGVSFAQVWQLMAPAAETGWRGALVQRSLYEAGVHLLDFAVALFGERPQSVQASVSNGGNASPASDAVVLVTLEFSGGRLAHLTQDRVCHGQRQYFEVRAETATASLRASFGGRSRLSAGLYRSSRPHVRFEHGLSGLAWAERGARRTVLARNPKAPMVDAARRLLGLTIDAFRHGTAPPTSGANARDLGVVVAAAYESAATGRRIPLEPLY
jgi:predicted dehydrogenase